MTETTRHTERIDEMSTLQLGNALSAVWGEIRCPNGCFDPYPVTAQHISAAMHLPRCEECDAYHVIEWMAEDDA